MSSQENNSSSEQSIVNKFGSFLTKMVMPNIGELSQHFLLQQDGFQMNDLQSL